MKKEKQSSLVEFQTRPVIIISKISQHSLKGGDDGGIGILDEVEG